MTEEAGTGAAGMGHASPQARAWTRYVAVGDSFTEGMSDPDPSTPDAYVGWADRLATLLAPHVEEFSYANLAVRGRKLADVTGPQLDAALALEPDLVSIVGGGNDLLRPRADVDALDLYISISALGFTYVSNRHTLKILFGRDLLAEAAVERRLETMTDMILRYLAP